MKGRLKFEIIGNKYLLRLIQFYLGQLKPAMTDLKSLFYCKILNRNEHINITVEEFLRGAVMRFEVTNLCNAGCVFCGHKYNRDVKGVMSFETFKKGLDEFIILGGSTIGLLPTTGEALLDCGLFKKIAYAKSKKLRVILLTNGLLLNKDENYERLIDSGIDEISISVGDVDFLNDSKIFGISVKQSVERWKGIHRLINYAKQKGKLGILKILFRPARPPFEIINDHLFKPLIEYFGRDETHIKFLLNYDNWAGSVSSDDVLGIMRLKRGLRNKFYPCSIMMTFNLTIDGLVRLCGCRINETAMDGLVLGNIYEKSLKDCIGDNLFRLLNSFATGRLPSICSDCSFYTPLLVKELNKS